MAKNPKEILQMIFDQLDGPYDYIVIDEETYNEIEEICQEE